MSCRRKSQTISPAHLLVEHRNQPAHGTHEYFSALAPVHVLRPVERGNFLGESLARISEAVRPLRVPSRPGIRLGVLTFSSFATSTPTSWQTRALPASAAHLYMRPARTAVHLLVMSGCDAGIPEARTATARRVEMRDRSGRGKTLALEKRASFSRSSREAASIIRAGISSHPISSKKSGIRRFVYVLRTTAM